MNTRQLYYLNTSFRLDHKHVPDKHGIPHTLTAVTDKGKWSATYSESLSNYIDVLDKFDELFNDKGKDAQAFQVLLRKKRKASFIGANRAAQKLGNLVLRSQHCGAPLFEIGFAPGHFLMQYRQTYKTNVCGGALVERLPKDLNANQQHTYAKTTDALSDRRFAKVKCGPDAAFLDMDAFCVECRKVLVSVCRMEGVRILASDVGFNIEYDKKPVDWLMYVANTVTDFGNSDIFFIFKIQTFGASVREHRNLEDFFHVMEVLDKTVSFVKPNGSWLGNDELYVVVQSRNDLLQQHDISSLNDCMENMTLYRNDLLRNFESEKHHK